MKITESSPVLLEQQGKINKTNNSESGSFQQIMDQVTSKTEEAGSSLPASINPVQIINPASGVMGIEGITPSGSPEKNELLDSLKDTLDLVDFYADKLGDKSFPAENLVGLIDQLDERLTSIKDMASQEGVSEKLKPVLTDMATSIGSEIERFRRGDYI